MNDLALAALYRSIVRCVECHAVIEERGLTYPHIENCPQEDA